MKSNLLLASGTCIMLLILSCQAPKQQESYKLGQLKHNFKIKKAAQPAFEKGLLLLHSFEYEDAREAFREALAEDDRELMAYWGEAMSHYKALWGLQNEDSGRAVLKRAGASEEDRMKLASSPLEMGFWKGVEILYGPGDLKTRNRKYADHMERLHQEFPNNQEVAAFYSLALMWTDTDGRTQEASGLAAQIAQEILDTNPLHPGALHYLIHANDDPNYAALSMDAADEYAQVAPDATHALHMPSHIYLAMGLWNEMVQSNETSYAASLNRMQRKGLDDKARGYHSYAWLHYGYLQQGRFDKATELLNDMQNYVISANNRISKRYLITMQCAQVAETGKWPLEEKPIQVDYENLGLKSKAQYHFLHALMAYSTQDAGAIAAHIDTLEVKIATAELAVIDEAIAICGGGPTRYAPSKEDILRANVMVNQMNAMISMIDMDEELTELFLIAATQLENDAEYSYGPPNIPYPSYEQYGEWLLSQGRAQEALDMFNKSLAVAKNRTRALDGKINALNMLNRTEEAEQIQLIIESYWKGIEQTETVEA